MADKGVIVRGRIVRLRGVTDRGLIVIGRIVRDKADAEPSTGKLLLINRSIANYGGMRS